MASLQGGKGRGSAALFARVFWILFTPLLILAGSGGVLYVDFTARMQSTADGTDLPKTAVIFTGQFDRIRAGLRLLEEGRIERLFVSGVNAKAGLDVGRFADQFGLSPEQGMLLSSGGIILAPDANTTLENAIETRCWLTSHQDIDAVILITSRRHLARASLALERAAPEGTAVLRLASDLSAERVGGRDGKTEFIKFTMTWLITLLPYDRWPSNQPRLCSSFPGGNI